MSTQISSLFFLSPFRYGRQLSFLWWLKPAQKLIRLLDNQINCSQFFWHSFKTTNFFIDLFWCEIFRVFVNWKRKVNKCSASEVLIAFDGWFVAQVLEHCAASTLGYLSPFLDRLDHVYSRSYQALIHNGEQKHQMVSAVHHAPVSQSFRATSTCRDTEVQK